MFSSILSNISLHSSHLSSLPEPIPQIGVKDTYLPFVLTKLKICGNNSEARKLIVEGKVQINNSVIKQSHFTRSLSNFLLTVNDKNYEIFKID